MNDTALMGVMIVAILLGAVGAAGAIANYQDDSVAGNSHPIPPPPIPFDDSDILQALTDFELSLIDQRNEYTREIVQTRKLLQDAQIGTGDSQKDKLNEQTGTGTSPKLTIHLDSNEYIRGEIIWISGTSDPSTPVEATVTNPNLGKRYPNASTDIRGDFKIGVFTDFDSPLGTYTVFVRSQGEISQTLSFNLKQ